MKCKLLLLLCMSVFLGQNLMALPAAKATTPGIVHTSGKKQAASPTITSFSPASGYVGTLVTIIGENLDHPSSVKIGGAATLVLSGSANKLVVMVRGTASGVVSLTTDGGTVASEASFTVKTTLPFPVVESGNKIIAAANSTMGTAAALSADGNTAIVGGDGDNNSKGAAWIYARAGNSWVQQGGKLVGAGSSAVAGQGHSVGISADGNTAVIGAPLQNNGEGAAWVFVRDDNGSWSQQGNQLIGSGAIGNAEQGYSVAISEDGNTIAIGGPDDNNDIGATWIFTRENGNWLQQGSKLIGTGASRHILGQGSPVVLRNNGNTLFIGSFLEGDDGSWWQFARVNNKWIQQGGKIDDLTAMDGIGLPGPRSDGFGRSANSQTSIRLDLESTDIRVIVQAGLQHYVNLLKKGEYAASVAISADGTTAIVGDYGENDGAGSIRFFVDGSTPIYPDSITFVQPGAFTYGAADVALNVRSTSSSKISLSSSDSKIVSINYDNTLHINAAGTVKIKASQPNVSRYVLPVERTIVIKKAPLNVIADDKFAAVSQPIPALTAAYSGFVNGETIAKLDTVAKLSTIATSSSPAGTYPIIASGASAKNYEITYTAGTLTIEQPGAPKIASFSPTSGQIGSLVTISGTNIGNPSAFTIGGKPAIVISSVPNKVVGMVMPGTTGGVVSLTTDSGTVVSTSAFVINPVTLFPVGQKGGILTGTGSVGYSAQGRAVAISADGNTAIVGGPGDNSGQGAAWIFVRNGNTWVQQGSKLSGTGSLTNAQQGYAVALSADGNTAVIGGYNYNNRQGAIWVFVRGSGGSWSQQGDKLIGTGAVGNASQGYSVAISADGNKVVVGGYTDNNSTGAAWVFVRNNGNWLQQGTKIVGAGGSGVQYQGQAVAMSADGNTLLLGAPGDGARGAWAFSYVNNSWVKKGGKFGVGNISEGQAVKLSADGKIAVVSSLASNENPGAQTYSRSIGSYLWNNDKWEFQISYNTAAGTLPGPGLGVDADVKNIVFIAPPQGQGAFVPLLSDWTAKPALLNRTGDVASDVAISADGMTAVIGAVGGAGAVRFYGPADYITFAQPADVTYGIADTALVASSTNTSLPITFTSSNNAIVSIVNNKLHIKATGTVNITAMQADANTVPTTRSLTINPARVTITADNKTKQPGTDNPVLTATYSYLQWLEKR